ncbi:MAG: preprotein translocase subunit SecG [Clostridia bacterium]|nr:preprotein translocase subunit SecG [Clostridia bacterium]
MNAFEIIIGAILIVFALLIIFVVLMQEGRQANVGVISGAADTFLDKGAAQTWDMRLAKWTKVIAIAFFVLVLAGMLVTKFLSTEALSGDKKEETSSSQQDDHAGHDHDHDHDHEESSTTTTTTTAAATTTTTAGK